MQGLDRAVGAIKSLIDYAALRKVVPDIASSSKRVGPRDLGADTEGRTRRGA